MIRITLSGCVKLYQDGTQSKTIECHKWDSPRQQKKKACRSHISDLQTFGWGGGIRTPGRGTRIHCLTTWPLPTTAHETNLAVFLIAQAKWNTFCLATLFP